jgi:hypothetical protein
MAHASVILAPMAHGSVASALGGFVIDCKAGVIGIPGALG